MEKDRKKPEKMNEEREIREPFRPEDTPQPPQIMDVSKDPETNEEESKDSETKNKPGN